MYVSVSELEMDGPLNHPPLDALLECLESINDDDDDDDGGDQDSGAGGAVIVDDSSPEDGAVENNRVTIADEVSASGEEESGDLAATGEPPASNQTEPVPSQPIIRRRASRTITNYLTSPHARRAKVKNAPCMFCPERKDVFSLRDHLETSLFCRSNYYSLMHVKSIDAVMTQSFVCIFCNNGGAKLKVHLTASNECFQSYCVHFNVNTIE